MKPQTIINIFYITAAGLVIASVFLKDDQGGFFNVYFWLGLFVYAVGELVKSWFKNKGKLDKKDTSSKGDQSKD